MCVLHALQQPRTRLWFPWQHAHVLRCAVGDAVCVPPVPQELGAGCASMFETGV